MAGFAGVAEEYFSSLNPIASRIHSDILETRNAYENLWDTLNDAEKADIVDECIIKPEIALKYAFLDPLDIDLDAKGFNKSDILSYFDLQCGKKVIHDDSTKFRDEHSGPFSFHTKSQLELCNFSEKKAARPGRAKPATPPILKSELALSHSKVLSELKCALKTSEKNDLDDSKEKQIEFSLKASKVIDEIGNAGGFISKLISNKKMKNGSAEEKEQLVSPGRQCQIVASSDNYFKTNFHGTTVVSAEPRVLLKETISSGMGKSISTYKNISGLEESRALLSGSNPTDSLGASTDSEFLSCDEHGSATSAEGTHGMIKTGLDFLDNW